MVEKSIKGTFSGKPKATADGSPRERVISDHDTAADAFGCR